jgi:hypothetical protein
MHTQSTCAESLLQVTHCIPEPTDHQPTNQADTTVRPIRSCPYQSYLQPRLITLAGSVMPGGARERESHPGICLIEVKEEDYDDGQTIERANDRTNE